MTIAAASYDKQVFIERKEKDQSLSREEAEVQDGPEQRHVSYHHALKQALLRQFQPFFQKPLTT